MNEHTPVSKDPYPVLKQLSKVYGQDPTVVDMWLMVYHMLHHEHEGRDQALRPLHYYETYVKSKHEEEGNAYENEGRGTELGGGTSSGVPMTFLKGAQRYLESSFYKFLEDTILKHPKASMMGGDPSVLKKVEAFLRFRFKKYDQWDLVDPELDAFGIPIWVMLFYLLRCGQHAEALQYASCTTFQASDDAFPHYLRAWCGQHVVLNPDFHGPIRAYYSALIQTPSVDPYKLAVYKLIGQCDVRHKKLEPNMIVSTEDWLWVRLMLLGSEFTIRDLHEEVAKLDPKILKATSTSSTSIPSSSSSSTSMSMSTSISTSTSSLPSPTKYFQLLITCGLFEKGITYLYGYPMYQLEALHFALALMYYGCLRIPEDPLSVSSIQFDKSMLPKYVPIQTLLQLYMETLDRPSQLTYLLRLPQYVHEEKKNQVSTPWLDLTHAWMTEWIRQAPTDHPIDLPVYALPLLHLDTYEAFQETIVAQAAEHAFQEDQMEVACFLFAQANLPSQVFYTLNQLMSRMVQQGPQFLSKSMDALLQDAYLILRSSCFATYQSMERTMTEVLVNFLEIKLVETQSKLAWPFLERTGFIPFNEAMIPGCLTKLQGIPPYVIACLPWFLRTTMDLTILEFFRTQDDRFKHIARTVRIFAGLLSVHLDTELQAYLAQKEVELSKFVYPSPPTHLNDV
ncbi:hypothetical protein HMI56_000644 [Coelomomyces lativittatus]|nr:hypothetical protein HMI56_000644 [Coelomomyces lativittatus]